MINIINCNMMNTILYRPYFHSTCFPPGVLFSIHNSSQDFTLHLICSHSSVSPVLDQLRSLSSSFKSLALKTTGLFWSILVT